MTISSCPLKDEVRLRGETDFLLIYQEELISISRKRYQRQWKGKLPSLIPGNYFNGW
jgi:hypothetical protein